MNIRTIGKRISALVLAISLLAGIVSVQPSYAATDITLPVYDDPLQDSTVVYYWHHGLPPTTVDGTKYPVYIVWNDAYYLSASELAGQLYDNRRSIAGRLEAYEVGGQIVAISDDPDCKKGSPYYAAGYYDPVRPYAFSQAKVSNIPFDLDAVRDGATAATIGLPDELPCLIATGLRGDDVSYYARKSDEHPEKLAGHFYEYDPELERGYFAMWLPQISGVNDFVYSDNWLVSTQRHFCNRVHYELAVMPPLPWTKGYDFYPTCVDTYLDLRHESASDFLDPYVLLDPYDTWSPYTHNKERYGDPVKIALQNRVWSFFVPYYYTNTSWNPNETVIKRETYYDTKYEELYRIDTLGTWSAVICEAGSEAGNLYDYLCENIGWQNSTGCYLTHSNNILYSNADREFGRPGDWKHRWTQYPNATYKYNHFDVFYGEPATMSMIQSSFSVESGQVVDLSGPVTIAPQATIRVKEGGVLNCSDWVINNGTIIVEQGGTLLLQTVTTGNDQTRYGTISTIDTVAGDALGRILCDGIMIVMPDCKVTGNGVNGLRFGEGAQVVNYGAIISENLYVFQDHTIENRGDNSWVFAGWSASGDGSILLDNRITGRNFPYLERKRNGQNKVNIPEEGVYGKGADRVAYNTSGVTVTKEKTKGSSSAGIVDPSSKDGLVASFTCYQDITMVFGMDEDLLSNPDITLYQFRKPSKFDLYDNKDSFVTTETGDVYRLKSNEWVYIYTGIVVVDVMTQEAILDGTNTPLDGILIYHGPLIDWRY